MNTACIAELTATVVLLQGMHCRYEDSCNASPVATATVGAAQAESKNNPGWNIRSGPAAVVAGFGLGCSFSEERGG